MTTRRKILKSAAALGAAATVTAGHVGAQAQEDRSMRRPDVLFFDSNESMLDLSGMRPRVTVAFGGREDLMAL